MVRCLQSLAKQMQDERRQLEYQRKLTYELGLRASQIIRQNAKPRNMKSEQDETFESLLKTNVDLRK